jgi:hypothetical protein
MLRREALSDTANSRATVPFGAFGRLPDLIALGPVCPIALGPKSAAPPLRQRLSVRRWVKKKRARPGSAPLVLSSSMTISLRFAPTAAPVQWSRPQPFVKTAVIAAEPRTVTSSALGILPGFGIGPRSTPSTLTFASVAAEGRAEPWTDGGWPLPRALLARLQGPGGLYNTGNLIGLGMGVGLQISATTGDATQAAASFLAGSPSAALMTIATLVFMISGEAYHRAWKRGFPPVRHLNVWGDALSGVGALVLGAALWTMGEPLLAATAGLMHACGKFGSALHRPGATPPVDWSQVFRVMVVASRLPAVVAALAALSHALPGGETAAIAAPVTLLVCYMVWGAADVSLMRK